MASSAFWNCALVLVGENLLVCTYIHGTAVCLAVCYETLKSGQTFLTWEMVFLTVFTTAILLSEFSREHFIRKLKVLLEVLQSDNPVISEIKANKTIEIKALRGVSLLPPAPDAFLYN